MMRVFSQSVNFINKASPGTLLHILEDFKEDKCIIIKTHGRLGIRKGIIDLINLGIQLGIIKVHACCRDSRDMALSLMDHGRRSR